jgi:predicted GIY-YIG superfamily endonuclease
MPANKLQTKERVHSCYVLIDDHYSYIGYTVNPKRRLKQHSRRVKSGARKTRKFVNPRFALVISGFNSEVTALQFEYKWNRGFAKRKQPSLRGKLTDLYRLLGMSTWPFRENKIDTATHPLLTISWLLPENQRPKPKRNWIQPDPVVPLMEQNMDSVSSLMDFLYPNKFIP